MEPSSVWVVGGPLSPKTNQWEHMTASKEIAMTLMATIPQGTMKEVPLKKAKSNGTKGEGV